MSFRDALIKIADNVKNVTLPTALDVRPHRLIIRTRIWSGQRPGDGTFTDNDLVLPQKFRIRDIKSSEVTSSGGRYEIGDVKVSGISKRPADDPTIGYSEEQLAPSIAGENIEVIYILIGPNPGEYSRIDLSPWRILSTDLILRRRTGDYTKDNMIRILGKSDVRVIQD